MSPLFSFCDSVLFIDFFHLREHDCKKAILSLQSDHPPHLLSRHSPYLTALILLVIFSFFFFCLNANVLIKKKEEQPGYNQLRQKARIEPSQNIRKRKKKKKEKKEKKRKNTKPRRKTRNSIWSGSVPAISILENRPRKGKTKSIWHKEIKGCLSKKRHVALELATEKILKYKKKGDY